METIVKICAGAVLGIIAVVVYFYESDFLNFDEPRQTSDKIDWDCFEIKPKKR